MTNKKTVVKLINTLSILLGVTSLILLTNSIAQFETKFCEDDVVEDDRNHYYCGSINTTFVKPGNSLCVSSINSIVFSSLVAIIGFISVVDSFMNLFDRFGPLDVLCYNLFCVAGIKPTKLIIKICKKLDIFLIVLATYDLEKFKSPCDKAYGLGLAFIMLIYIPVSWVGRILLLFNTNKMIKNEEDLNNYKTECSVCKLLLIIPVLSIILFTAFIYGVIWALIYQQLVNIILIQTLLNCVRLVDLIN